MKKVGKKKWVNCPDCKILIYANAGTRGNHVCHEKIRAKREAELDMVIFEELETWDGDLKKFWQDKDTQFYEWLVKHGRY